MKEQAEGLARAWADAQRRIWMSWFDALEAATESTPAAAGIRGWRDLAEQGLRATTGEGASGREAAERLLSGHESILQLVELTTAAWKAMVPMLDGGGTWEEAIREYGDRLRQDLAGALADPAAAAQDVTHLWQLYLDEVGKLSKPWLEALRPAREHLGRAAGGDHSALIRFTDLYWDAFERSFGRLIESPSIGYTRELNERLLGAFDSWLHFRRASFQYQVVLAGAWARSFESFMRELVSLGERGEKIGSLRELLTLWTDASDTVLIEVFGSEEYARAQGEAVNAAMAYRLRERDAVEVFLKMSHLPTRDEMDGVTRSIYELRKELRALRKLVAEREEAGAEHGGAAGPPPRPARRKAPARPKPAPKVRGKDGG